jgi:hypothetical protein
MLPHPTTMSFAWDKEVLRGSQVLLFVFGLAIAVLFGGVMLLDRAPNASSTVAAELSTRETHLSAPALAVFSAE